VLPLILLMELSIQFANYITSADHPNDLDDKYKSSKLFLRCAFHCLSGGYTNFGVFDMYNDSILTDILSTTTTVIFLLDSALLENYPKCFSLVFSVLATLSTNHSSFLITLEKAVFGKVLSLLLRGIQSPVKDIVTESCTALDKLFSLHASNLMLAQQNRLNARSATPRQIEMMSGHLVHNQRLVSGILVQMLILAVTHDNVACVSKPLLALILLFQNDFGKIKELVVSSQGFDEGRAMKVGSLFNQLMADIKMNLHSENQDKFLLNLTAFHTDIQNLLDMNEFYKVMFEYSKE